MKKLKRILLFSTPLILAIDLYCFSWITELLSQQSDVAVFIGLGSTCAFITGNYYLIKYLLTTKN